MRKVYVIKSGPLFYVANMRWSEERPDAMEFDGWRQANDKLDRTLKSYPDSPTLKAAEVVEEEAA